MYFHVRFCPFHVRCFAYLTTNSVKTNMLIGFKTTINQDIFIQSYRKRRVSVKFIFDESYG